MLQTVMDTSRDATLGGGFFGCVFKDCDLTYAHFLLDNMSSRFENCKMLHVKVLPMGLINSDIVNHKTLTLTYDPRIRGRRTTLSADYAPKRVFVPGSESEEMPSGFILERIYDGWYVLGTANGYFYVNTIEAKPKQTVACLLTKQMWEFVEHYVTQPIEDCEDESYKMKRDYRRDA